MLLWPVSSTCWPSVFVLLGQGSVTFQPGGPNRDREEATRVKVGKRHLLRGIFGLSGSSSPGPAGIGAVGPESERGRETLGLSPAVALVLGCRIPHLSSHPFIPPTLLRSCLSTLMHAFLLSIYSCIPSSIHPSIPSQHLFILPNNPPLPPSRFSRVRLCATPQTAAHQAPRSLGFSRQEHWSGLPFPSPMHESEKRK